ncbi:hypothetical protein HII31_10641 [Pseudocercospora fuligena]|uniref:Uncharacterized protein n=1 Tax=Pseudocercospora fuligena TaxID=685502 RepID=A0A8H6VHA1_9PEZI|nr:hypothetical protein HII31_10641 [Pseudocercospora fuligena]
MRTTHSNDMESEVDEQLPPPGALVQIQSKSGSKFRYTAKVLQTKGNSPEEVGVEVIKTKKRISVPRSRIFYEGAPLQPLVDVADSNTEKRKSGAGPDSPPGQSEVEPLQKRLKTTKSPSLSPTPKSSNGGASRIPRVGMGKGKSPRGVKMSPLRSKSSSPSKLRPAPQSNADAAPESHVDISKSMVGATGADAGNKASLLTPRASTPRANMDIAAEEQGAENQEGDGSLSVEAGEDVDAGDAIIQLTRPSPTPNAGTDTAAHEQGAKEEKGDQSLNANVGENANAGA